jgi:hypothetical protein
MIGRKRHLDVERIAGAWHIFRTVGWHPTDQDAGAADVFNDLHGSAGSFATRSDAAFERKIHALVRTLLQSLEKLAIPGSHLIRRCVHDSSL